MPDGTAESVLERKATAQRRALGVGAVSIPRALRRSLSIAADALWALGVSCTLKSDDLVSTDRALARLDPDQLFIILEKDGGPAALVALDRHMVTGLIEVQTLGKVTRFPLDDRPFTPTDAAMMAPLVDAALPRFGSMVSTQPERAHLRGYVFGAQADDVQIAGLALDADQMHAVHFDVSLANGTRDGRMAFLFPEPDPAPERDGARKGGKYEEAMKMVPARMHAVLTRIHIPLAKAQALKPGDVLEISPNAILAATLVVDGGHVAAKGKMGQMNGFRAIRIGGDMKLLHKPAPPQDMSDAPPATPPTVGASLDFPAPPSRTTQIVNPPQGQDVSLEGFSTGPVDPADLL